MHLARFAQRLRAYDWTAAVIELVIVIGGILIALQVNNWNQDRLDRARAQVYTRRIHADLQLPPSSGRLRARLHEIGAVRGESHDEHGWNLRLDLAEADAVKLAMQSYGAPLQALLPEPLADPV